METINLKSINQKTDRYINSSKGKKKAQNCINKYIHENKPKTSAGSPVPTIRMMKQAATDLVNTMLNTAKGYDVPESVLDHIRGMADVTPVYFTDGVHKNGAYKIDMNFTGDPHRDSLEPDKYDGVDNIVLVFNNGYSKESIKYVEGFWHGEYINALPTRTGLHFIEHAIREFNMVYGAKYDVTVWADVNPT